MLYNTTVKIPQDGGPGEEREIEKTPLCHPPPLRAEINEGGRRRRRRTEMKVGARWKMKAESHTSQEAALSD